MDTSEAYRAVRDRMIDLVDGVDGTQAVPACPGWTVRDLMAHVTGVVDDILEGRMDDVATEGWTGAQVSTRAGRTVAEVAQEWAALAPRLDAVFDVIGGAPGQLVFDAVTHEHDLRHALRAPGARDDAGVEMALTWVAEAWAATASGASAPLRLVAGDVSVTTGDGEPGATVEMEPFEALRALTGRRKPRRAAGLPVGRRGSGPVADLLRLGPVHRAGHAARRVTPPPIWPGNPRPGGTHPGPERLGWGRGAVSRR